MNEDPDLAAGHLVPQRKARRRSIAWLFYSVLAVGGLIGSISAGSAGSAIASVAVGLYAVYLYRGGRIVIWFW